MSVDDILPAVIALVLVVYGPLWSRTRHVVTLVHEGGHALAALLTGRRLSSITLATDTSGLTVSRGRPRGPGMIVTAAAGYLAPAIFGLLVAVLIGFAYSEWALWFALAVLAIMLLHIRNWFGLFVVLVSSVVVAALVWRAPVHIQRDAAMLCAWFMLLGAPRAAVELGSYRRRSRSRSTDADVLARLTHLPAILWVGFFVLMTFVALAVGTWSLVVPPR